MPLQPGTRVGAYEIRESLGGGGMGEVYRAYDARLEREVAIKVVRDLGEGDRAEQTARFRREARSVARLNHHGIVGIHDIGEWEGAPFIVMEILHGETLKARLTRGALPALEAIRLLRQAAEALAAAHEAGLVHRDIKPENLFLTESGALKILDFGLAKKMLGPEDRTESLATQAGAILGTLAYLSPEQARGERVDARTDVFALGAVLLEMLTGRPAFARATAVATLSAILAEDPLASAALPPDFRPVLDRCLDKDPEGRFPDAGAVLTALDRLGARPKESRRRLALAIGAAGLVLVSAGAWLRWNARAGTPPAPAADTRSPGWEALQAARYLDKRTNLKDLEGKSAEADPVAQAYKAALAKDPGLVAADLGLADHLVTRVFWNRRPGADADLAPEAFVSLSRILAKDPKHVQALVLRSNLSFTPDAGWRMEDALSDAVAAMRLDPHNPKVLGCLGGLLEHMGLAAEARRVMGEAIRVEGSNRDFPFFLARVEAMDMDPGAEDAFRALAPGQRMELAVVLERQGRHQEADAFMSQYKAAWWTQNPLDDGTPFSSDFAILSIQALLEARRGRAAEAMELVKESERLGRDLSPFHHAAYYLACACAAAHQSQEALRFLRYTAEHGYPCFSAYLKDPLLDPLRGDPAFQAFLETQRYAAEARRKVVTPALN